MPNNCVCDMACYIESLYCGCNGGCYGNLGCKGDSGCPCYNGCYLQICQCNNMKYAPEVWLFY